MRSVFLLILVSVVVWAWCGAVMGIGLALLTVGQALIVHLLGAGIGAAIAGWLYQRLAGGFAPWVAAASFVAVALALDLFLVAMVIMRSFEMFTLMGAWLPLALVFVAAWLAGTAAQRAPHAA